MTPLRIIIADDERPAREFLKAILRSFETAEIVGEADNGPDAIDLINREKPDLALLDLQMPEMSGLDVVRALDKSQIPLVAFVTAFDEYAVQAFEINAVDYLLKPVETARLRETITRAAERLEEKDWREAESQKIVRATDDYESAFRGEPLTRIPVRHREDIYLIPINDVASIVADGELLRITTNDNRKHVVNHRLKDLETRLDPARFIRLSRGAIINLDSLKSVSPLPGGTYLITLNNGQEIQSSRMQSKFLRSKLLKL